MSRADILKILHEQLPLLQAEFGFTTLSVFGSVARDEETESSDVDVLVAFPRGGACGFFRLFELQQRLETSLQKTVDLVTEDALKRQLKEAILAEAIRVA